MPDRRTVEPRSSAPEEVLRDAWLLTLVEQLKDHAIFVIGRDGTNLTWNEGVRRLLGYDEEEFLGRPTAQIFTPEDQEEGVPSRELAYAAEHGSASDERWLVRKDGGRLWASGVTSRLEDADRNLIGFGKIFRDLTVEREFQEMQRRSEERYRLATRAAREAIWDRDLNTHTITWSDGFELLFGYSADEVGPGVAWWEERVHPDDRPRIIEAIREAVLGGRTYWEGDYRFRRTSGDYAQVEDRAYIMRDSDGEPLRMLGSMADVTERRRAEEALRQAQRLEAVGQLAGGIAHDLNNTLVAIIGYTELLARSMGRDDPQRKNIEHVLRSANRSAALTRQLLAFARRQMIHPTLLDMNAVITEMSPMLRPLLTEAISLEHRLAGDLAPVYADRGQIEQILVNLVVNARDAMPQGGRVTVETSNVALGQEHAQRHRPARVAAGRYAMLAVSDTGVGMEREAVDRAFEPFFTTKPFGQGTGLGLASVYGIVKQNNGHVWAYSEPGEGTVIKVYLPIADGESAAVTGTQEGALGETILVVEDDIAVLQFTCHLLRHQGYRCIGAASGRKALESLDQYGGPIHLLIVDVVLPEMSGRELGERLTASRPDVPIIYVSGYSADEIMRRGLLPPETTFLEKPYHPDALLRLVRDVLEQRATSP